MTRYLFVPLSITLLLLPFFASAATCPNLYRNLSFGSRGQDVIELQIFLIAQGDLAVGNNTGYFGRLTVAAVQKWQARNGVVSSGTAATTGYGAVGPRTRAKIAQVCGAGGNVSTNFSAHPMSGSAPLSVTFTAGGLAHRWPDPNNPGVFVKVIDQGSRYINFGDGSAKYEVTCVNATGPTCTVHTTHAYQNSGTYTASLVDHGGYCAVPCPHVPISTVTITVSGLAPSCADDVTVAKTPPSGSCTAQSMDLRCPRDANYVYSAPNGCQIHALQSRGWTEVKSPLCASDVTAATAPVDGGCTAQIMNMRCPHDYSYVHAATNGCQISTLQSRGWTEE